VPVNLNTQALPSTETVKFAGVPTVWAQCAAVSVFAAASGAFTTEIADRAETIKTKGRSWIRTFLGMVDLEFLSIWSALNCVTIYI
jgi:hypothetical protein